MARKDTFLSALKRLRNGSDDKTTKSPAELRIQLCVDHDDSRIRLVDSEGTPCKPKDYTPEGRLGPLIRTLSDIGLRGQMDFNWSNQPGDTDYPFAKYPYLASFLEDNPELLVDNKMKPIKFVAGSHTVCFSVKSEGDDNSAQMLRGRFSVRNVTITSFLTPTIVLAGSCLYHVENVGERWKDLNVFTAPFDADFADVFFSVFFSTVDNVRLDLEGRTVRFADETIPMTPVLVMEKIDSDNSQTHHTCRRQPSHGREQLSLSIQKGTRNGRLSHRPLTATDIKRRLYLTIGVPVMPRMPAG